MPELAGNLAQLCDGIVGRTPGCERIAQIRRTAQIVQCEEDDWHRLAHRVVVAQRFFRCRIVVLRLGRFVARELVVLQQLVVALERNEVLLIAADRIGLQVDDQLLLRLRPHALSIEQGG